MGAVDETVIQGLDWKQSVRAVSTGNVALSDSTAFTLDGVSLANEDRVLLKDQSTGAENGIYDVTTDGFTYSLARSLDASQDVLTAGAAVFVEEGSTNADCAFVLTTNDPITVDSTTQTWVKFAGAGSSIFVSTTTPTLLAKTPYAVSIDTDSRYPSALGSDVFFFVSGSIGATGNNDKKSLFGGDLCISGALSQGYLGLASGTSSHVEGYTTYAYGNYSHAEGTATQTSGHYSHAEGFSTSAQGESSHAEGSTTTSTGVGSHSEGTGTSAAGNYSHAEGSGTDAAGYASHAEGLNTRASGESSHAEGFSCETSGSYSHAEGLWTVASGSGQTTVGSYNLRGNDFSLFVVGDGTSDVMRGDIVRVNPGPTVGDGQVQVTGSLVSSLG